MRETGKRADKQPVAKECTQVIRAIERLQLSMQAGKRTDRQTAELVKDSFRIYISGRH
jgi:hypothetical protein